MTKEPDSSDGPTRWGRIEWKTILAIAALLFGITQFLITQRSEREKQRLQLELDEQRSYGAVAHYLKSNHDELGNLITRLTRGSGTTINKAPEALKGSLLLLKNDNTPDAKGRLGGWPGMTEVHARAARSRAAERDQEYRFLRINNIGQRTLDIVHVKFDTGEDATVRNLYTGSAVLIPIEIVGLHANLTSTQRRIPVEAYYGVMSLGQTKRKPIDVAFRGDWYTTDSPGVWQALPEFNKD